MAKELKIKKDPKPPAKKGAKSPAKKGPKSPAKKGPMSTKKLLKETVRLQDELAKHGPTERWMLLRQISQVLLKMYQNQLDHESWRTKQGAKSKPGERFNEADRMTLKEVAAVHAQITKKLSADRKKKK